MAQKFTFYVYDLTTNTKQAELPLTNVTYSSKLNSIGSFSGTLKMDDPRLNAGVNLVGVTNPGKTALYVDADGVLVWGGIIWTRKYQHSTRQMVLGASEFLSYWTRRHLISTTTFTGADTGGIARTVLSTLTSAPFNNDIGLTLAAAQTTGSTVTKTYNWYEYKQVDQIISDYSKMAVGGYDFAIDVAYDSSGNPTRTFNVAAPRRGRVAGSTGLAFDSATGFIDYTWPEDATQQADQAYLTGAGSGDSMLHSASARTDAFAGGYPLLEGVYAVKDVDTQNVLDQRAIAYVNAYAFPVQNPQIVYRTNVEPLPGSYITGDDARVIISDERFLANATTGAPGLDAYLRILGWKASIADDGGVSSIALDFLPY